VHLQRERQVPGVAGQQDVLWTGTHAAAEVGFVEPGADVIAVCGEHHRHGGIGHPAVVGQRFDRGDPLLPVRVAVGDDERPAGRVRVGKVDVRQRSQFPEHERLLERGS
jgi:hypothetical protein